MEETSARTDLSCLNRNFCETWRLKLLSSRLMGFGIRVVRLGMLLIHSCKDRNSGL